MTGDSSPQDDPFQVAASSSIADTGTQVLKHGDTFAVFSRFGDIFPIHAGQLGVFHENTRYLSRFFLRLGSERLLLLNSSVQENTMLVVDMMNPEIRDSHGTVVPHGTLHLRRSKFLWEACCYERLVVSNFGAQRVRVELELDFDADFADLFEVRGMERERRGTYREAKLEPGAVSLSYLGLDGVVRETRIEFVPAPSSVAHDRARFPLDLAPRQTIELFFTVIAERAGEYSVPRFYQAAQEKVEARLARLQEGTCRIVTSHEQFNDWLIRSRSDLHMMVSDTAEGPYPYAGIPWFSTPFGRDGIWTALQSIWVMPELARGVLGFLAANQAMEMDDERDAEPGKILHEMRQGEMAALKEVPFGKYYGSIDSTPLFVMLAAEYYTMTGELAFIERLWPAIRRAVDWIDRFGDQDGDGFIEYGKRARHGLDQQGWKDSRDSVFHSDGRDATPPIALCEVQGYVFAAKRGAAMLAGALGDAALERQLLESAARLREQFDKQFWCEDLGTYALALDGEKRPCRVKTSNVGHCLFSGIAYPDRALVIAEGLLRPEMFSGWGIRTLSNDEVRYNPMAYHNGSVWPHDCAIVAEGLARYGHKAAALKILSAMFDVSLSVELRRIPELFCGFPREKEETPTLYPVACSPQAWASGAAFLLLKAALGLRPDATKKRLVFEYPTLPSSLDWLELHDLRVGRARLSVALHRHPDDVGVNILQRDGELEVFVRK